MQYVKQPTIGSVVTNMAEERRQVRMLDFFLIETAFISIMVAL